MRSVQRLEKRTPPGEVFLEPAVIGLGLNHPITPDALLFRRDGLHLEYTAFEDGQVTLLVSVLNSESGVDALDVSVLRTSLFDSKAEALRSTVFNDLVSIGDRLCPAIRTAQGWLAALHGGRGLREQPSWLLPQSSASM